MIDICFLEILVVLGPDQTLKITLEMEKSHVWLDERRQLFWLIKDAFQAARVMCVWLFSLSF